MALRPVGDGCPNALNTLSVSEEGNLKLSQITYSVQRFGRLLPCSISQIVCFDVLAFSANCPCVRPRYARLALNVANAGPKFVIFPKIYGRLFTYRFQFEPVCAVPLRELGQRYGTFDKNQFIAVFF